MIAMIQSNQLLLMIVALIAVSGGSAMLLNWSFRRHGSVVKGLGSALFIMLCWAAVLLLIIYRTAN
jgi:hypothetical protein